MTWWYSPFMFAVLVLWATSVPKDRNALRIVLLASIGSELLKYGVTMHIHAPWKLVIPGAVETLTILCLIRWARNWTGYAQVLCLVFAWFAHALCYADIILRTDLVYSRYEHILGVIAAAQIAACHDTIRYNLSRLGHWLALLWPRRHRDIRVAGVCHSVLPSAGHARIQTIP